MVSIQEEEKTEKKKTQLDGVLANSLAPYIDHCFPDGHSQEHLQWYQAHFSAMEAANPISSSPASPKHHSKNQSKKHKAHHQITPSMRCKLINWLIEVSLHFRLLPETLFLAVHYLDRYSCVRPRSLAPEIYQLAGITCLFIASKWEEIYPPRLEEFSSVCDGACPQEFIYEMEIDILMSIDWCLGVGTVYSWISFYLDYLRNDLPGAVFVEGSDGDREPSNGKICDLKQSAIETSLLLLHTPIQTEFPYEQIAACIITHLIAQIDDKNDSAARTKIFKKMKTTSANPNTCANAIKRLSDTIKGSIVFYMPDDNIDDVQFDQCIVCNAGIMKQLFVSLNFAF